MKKITLAVLFAVLLAGFIITSREIAFADIDAIITNINATQKLSKEEADELIRAFGLDKDYYGLEELSLPCYDNIFININPTGAKSNVSNPSESSTISLNAYKISTDDPYPVEKIESVELKKLTPSLYPQLNDEKNLNSLLKKSTTVYSEIMGFKKYDISEISMYVSLIAISINGANSVFTVPNKCDGVGYNPTENGSTQGKIRWITNSYFGVKIYTSNNGKDILVAAVSLDIKEKSPEYEIYLIPINPLNQKTFNRYAPKPPAKINTRDL
ncbi:MAG: hypothetical protein NTW04_02370 [Elusimicrobia bacterium]|nr:hypothetical protein [Elusimicrobiota bacterium]